MKIQKQDFGQTGDGHSAFLFSLSNTNGMQVEITNYGGIITSMRVPDREGCADDVCLGFDNLEDYINSNPYFGCIVGRYGNRIAKGQFALNGETYCLAANNEPNHLHGGNKGFDKVIWDFEEVYTDDSVGLALTYLSPDGEEGYPGNLSVTMTYTLTRENGLRMDYTAATDKPTIVNLTNHAYFNLADGGESPILEHILTIDADKVIPVDETAIPLGEMMPVESTPFDFRTPKAIGKHIDAEHPQIRCGHGYDHNFILNGQPGQLRLAARVSDPKTGRVLEVHTGEPGIQLYTGNFLDGTLTGKGGTVYQQRTGFCLETQHYPDSPNRPDFPSTVLNPGETYRTATVYQFLVD